MSDNRVLALKNSYINQAENELAKQLIDNDYIVTKKGWPDFFCLNEQGNAFVVEVKSRSTHRLKKSQEMILKFLVHKGVRCYRYAPDSGLVEYHG